MSWTEGNKRWTIPFMSLNGTSCHIDIYKRGYTGSTVIELSENNANAPGVAAADPFEYSENDDEDLLNKVIRYRTGYIRVVEDSYGSLDEIYPSVNTDRRVEFYYGNDLDFVGYIQAQRFENSWEAGRRVLELPVISPLGLASGKTFDWEEFSPPSWMSIFGVLQKSFKELDESYIGLYFPQYLPHVNTLDMILADLYINTLTFCPFDGKYNKNTTNLKGIYKSKTIEETLTMICTGFGLILHDAPDNVIFQRLDWTGDYVHKSISNGARTRATQTTYDLTSLAEVASNSNTESMVMPLSKIEVTYDGEDSFPNMTFDRCHGYSRGCAIPDRGFCTNEPNIDDFDGSFTNYTSIDGDGLLTKGDICLGAYGAGGLAEMIMWRPNDNWETAVEICRITFYEWNGESFRLKLNHKYGTSIENLKNPSANNAYATIGVRVQTGSRYFDTQSGWLPLYSAPINVMTKQFNDGRVECEVGVSPYYYMVPQPLDIIIFSGGNRSDWIRTISNVSIERFETQNDAYLMKNQDLKTYTIDGDPSDMSGSLKRGIGVSSPTMNRIRMNENNVTGTAEVDIHDNEPKYPYLLEAQDRLKLGVNMIYQTSDIFYLNRFTVWGSSNKHRVIARSFKPWNDLVEITLHHSPVFD